MASRCPTAVCAQHSRGVTWAVPDKSCFGQTPESGTPLWFHGSMVPRHRAVHQSTPFFDIRTSFRNAGWPVCAPIVFFYGFRGFSSQVLLRRTQEVVGTPPRMPRSRLKPVEAYARRPGWPALALFRGGAFRRAKAITLWKHWRGLEYRLQRLNSVRFEVAITVCDNQTGKLLRVARTHARKRMNRYVLQGKHGTPLFLPSSWARKSTTPQHQLQKFTMCPEYHRHFLLRVA